MLTSGYRPGAITQRQAKLRPLYYPSKAIDVSGSSGAMARFFTWLIGQRDVKQAFYDPLGSIFGGISRATARAGTPITCTYPPTDSGCLNLRPGWNLVYNFTGRNEPVFGAASPSTSPTTSARSRSC